jgi:Sulfotransferase family
MDGPDFLCIGAQKAGTGWLYEQLRVHPDFWMPPLKELHYFDRLGRARREREHGRLEAARGNARDERDVRFLDRMEELCANPEIDFEMYARLFAAKGASISGDITPGYSTLPDEMVERVVDRFPKLKVLFIARDPVERAWSQLSMWVRHGIIDSFAENDFQTVTQHLQRPEVMLRSRPSEIVRRWRRSLAQKSFGFYFFDDLKRNPSEVRSAMIEWLGGDARKPSGKLTPRHNPKARKEKLLLSEGMRAHLAKFFEAELKASASEFGGPATEWPKRYGL